MLYYSIRIVVRHYAITSIKTLNNLYRKLNIGALERILEGGKVELLQHCPYHIAPFTFVILSNAFFKPSVSSAPHYSFYPPVTLHTLISPWLFPFFLRLLFSSNTVFYFDITMMVYGKPFFSFSKKTSRL